MDAGFSGRIKDDNPRSRSNPLSKLFLIWMMKLCYKGTRKSLKIADLFKTLKADGSELLTDKLEINWNLEVLRAKNKKKSEPSLLRALVKTFFWQYMFYGIYLVIQYLLLRPFQPVVMAYFITLFSEPTPNYEAMYISGSIIVLQSLFGVFFLHHSEFGQSSVGMRIRIAVSSLVYRKLLKLNKKSLGQTAAGQVVNLLSNDVSRFDMLMTTLHFLWIMPLQVVLIGYLIWREVQISTLAGVLSMAIFTIPGQAYLTKLTSRLRLKVALRTDHRVKLMNEVISGILVIKMYAWEKPFENLIEYARKKEIDVITYASYLRGIYVSCMVFIERTALYCTVICYSLLGNNITADIVFSMAQFYNALQLAMAILYPMAVSVGAETWISIKRLQEFLVLEEIAQSVIDHTAEKDLILKQVSAEWTPGIPTIENFNVYIPSGTLCAIVGPVGAGKSSMLQLLLGELPPSSGSISVGGTISYSAQEPWLFVSTARSNILFGQDYDKLRYRNTVKVCALEKDFEQLPNGDKTMVGERGVSLSGGQRARINLARAVYKPADIYLLDDPLSAVDTHVGKHLFEECIVKYLREKTRILVTHQLQYLKKADLIIVVNEGRIEAKGTFEELAHTNLDFTKLLVAADETADKEKEDLGRKDSILSSNSLVSELSESGEKLGADEEMSNADATPFKDYVRASGNCWTISLLFVILVLSQGACSGTDYWVTYWTQQEAIRHSNTSQLLSTTYSDAVIEISSNLTSNASYYQYNNQWDDVFTDELLVGDRLLHVIKTDVAIYVYSALVIVMIFLTMIRSFTYFKMVMLSSRNLHNKMFHALLRAPMRFFDTNPSGRVLNRFSKDMGAVDELLPRVLMDAIQILLVMSGILVMVTVANYYMVIAMVVIGAVFLKTRAWYISTAKDVKHLEGITKSPVFSHLNSSLNGITTIRAAEAEGVLKKQFDHHQDAHTSAWFLTIATRVAFGLWLDLLSVAFVAVVIYSFIVLAQFGQISGSVVGLAISQSLILTGMLQFGMRQTAEVVNQLTSVERVMQYTKLEDEQKDLETYKPLPLELLWPSKGIIEFQDLSLRYSQFESPVLRNLNFTIAASSKVGVVGRTGAGKSSLIAALFRLAPAEGRIIIDGIDTKTLRLGELRKQISIIPQEPVLFSASLRYNLDPFQEFEDQRLWEALDEVELKDAITNLDFMVLEGGSNFSVGQRQLVCLARAILRNNKILVLDEATANVDARTDALIQNTIRRKFKDCTVLTIAHRLHTIMDSDKVLVMEGGRMVEYDHPHILLQDPSGYFSRLVSETGPLMTEQLRQISHSFYLSSIKE